MPRKKQRPSVKEDVTCNLIPMVDIMFLLLLFFILGADMSQREQADLVLPEASEIKENEKVKSADPITEQEAYVDSIGIVTVHDGPSLEPGEIIAGTVEGKVFVINVKD